MRICLFLTSFLPLIGGAERSADVVARGLLERGHQVRVLAQWTGRKPCGLPYPVHHYLRLPRQNLWPEAMAWPLARTHWAHPFDLVLAFDSYPAGYAAAWIKRKLGFRVIITPRGGDLQENFYSLRRARVGRALIHGYQNADRLVAISHWLKTRLHQVAGDTLPPIDVVHNGIDLATHQQHCQSARSRPPCLPIERPFALHLARVNPHKQQITAVRAVHALRDLFLAQKMTYVIAGDGRGLREVEDLIRELNLSSIIRMIGPREGIERAWLYDHASFFVSASLGEGFGNVLLEAMASGLPILASSIPASREVLADYPAARFFTPGSVEDLTAKLRCMMDGAQRVAPDHFTRIIAENFSLKTMVDGYERACLASLNGKSA